MNPRLLSRAARLVWRSTPGWTAVNAALLVLQGLFPLMMLLLMKAIVDAVTIAASAPDKKVAFGRVIFYLLLSLAITVLNLILGSVSGYVSSAQSQTFADFMNGLLQTKAAEVDLQYYENWEYFNQMQRAQSEAAQRPIRIVNNLVGLGQSIISLIAVSALLLSLHWAIAIVLLIATVPVILARLKFAKVTYDWEREKTSVERQAWHWNYLLTGAIFAKEIRLFNLGPLFIDRYRDLRRELREGRLRLILNRSLATFLLQAFALAPVFGCYGFIAYRVVYGYISLGGLVMYYQAFQRGQGYLDAVFGGLSSFYEDNLFLNNLFEFLDLKRNVIEVPNPRPIPRPMREGFIFDHVSFQYPETDRMALQDVSLTIRPGEVIALVGWNGSGKTTLAKLLCRLYDPSSGRITLDGIDLRHYGIQALRREIGVLFQDYSLYQTTARENIWFGDIETDDDDQIVRAARASGAHEVISGLKHGYETLLGKWWEEGEELSIGQWQKVALARAFLRDAQTLILDEPTSALDPDAESEVFQKFREHIRGRSAILISHRLSTVRMADRIYVMEEGRIKESGSHDELIGRDGQYARLFETQAQYYR